MKLYGISEADILKTIQSPDIIEPEGEKLIVIKKFPGRFEGYPLKVVYKVSDDNNKAIITAYPLKRKNWR